MKPTRNNVLVSRVFPSLETTSGIILKNPLDPDRALIEEIGPEVTEVSVGDETIIEWNKANDIGDGKYIISIENVVMILGK